MDAKTVFASDEFGHTAKAALTTPGTVTLPGPPPATGHLYLGINPDHIFPDHKLGLQLSGPPRFFLRLVQTVSPALFVTRILDLKELRGISVPAACAAEGGALREFKTVSDLRKVITDAVHKLAEAEKKKAGVYEISLFDEAVICVPESAPVYVRVKFEFGVSAVEAAENIDGLLKLFNSCPCPWIVPFPWPTVIA